MENSMRLGLMTVFAVSGSMVLLVHQVHKHLFNNFMEKFECEIRPDGHHPKTLNGIYNMIFIFIQLIFNFLIYTWKQKTIN